MCICRIIFLKGASNNHNDSFPVFLSLFFCALHRFRRVRSALPCRGGGGGGARADKALWPGRSLTGKKKLFRNMVFSKTTACSSYVQPWLVEIAGWRLVVGGGSAVGSSWQLVMGGWWRLAAVDGWRLAVGGWWRLAVGGSWRLAVGGPLGRSLSAVLNKKKIWSLKDRPASG